MKRAVWPEAPSAVAAADQLPAPPELPRVKVLHVITRFIAGSGGNTLVSATGMDQAKYESWVAAMPGGPLWDPARTAGVRTVPLRHMRERISPWHDLLACVELVRLIRRERFTVVHTHCSKAGFIGRVAAWIAGVPAVVHTFHILAVHPGLGPVRRQLYLTLDRLARPLAHRYVAVAPRVARSAVELGFAGAGRISVIPSAIDVDAIPTAADPSLRASLGVEPDVPLIGTVGRLVAQKSPVDFVRMCALVQAQRPEARFVMVGDTTLESDSREREAREEAERLGVPVIFTGFRADAPQLAASFDVYVVPSRYEGLGRAVTEAMASARPVVATAVNGVPDLVEHGASGLLAEPGDPRSLADAVLWLLDNPAAARTMGLRGRDRVRWHFRPGVMCGALDALYSDLIGLPEPPEPAAARYPQGEVGPFVPRQQQSRPDAVLPLRTRAEADRPHHS